MNPKILCTQCSGEILPGDKFCKSCGAQIEWDALSRKDSPAAAGKTPQTPDGSATQCPLCGHKNPPANTHCASCGAALPGKTREEKKKQSAKPLPTGKPNPLHMLQSWKVTAAMGFILVSALVAIKLNHNTDDAAKPAAAGMPNDAHQNTTLMAELETLEKAAQANPTDAPTQLQLANHLQDAKFLTKAIEAYKKYLALKPADANAHVDMGVTFYEMAMTDTLQRDEYLQSADMKFHDALKINAKHQLAHFNLGIVSLMRGDLMTANDWFKKTIAIDSTTETGKRAEMLIHQHTFTNSSPTQQ